MTVEAELPSHGSERGKPGEENFVLFCFQRVAIREGE
jgi:hypothetical protein